MEGSQSGESGMTVEFGMKVNILRYNELDEDIIGQWSDLELRSADGNAYLSPHFVIPAIKYLTPAAAPVFLIVTKRTGSKTILTGLGIFEYSRGTIGFPLPHLKAYRSRHSFLGGLLVDEQHIQPTLNALFTYLQSARNVFGIEFVDLIESTALAEQIDVAARQCKMPWFLDRKRQRAVLMPPKIDQEYIETHLSQKNSKSLRRDYKYLSKFGDVRWNLVRGREVDKAVIDRFLQLEHMGWKGKNGTSLLSNSGNEKFFCEMVGNFSRHDRVFFAELRVNDRVISSTANLLSSKAGYALKSGGIPSSQKPARENLMKLNL